MFFPALVDGEITELAAATAAIRADFTPVAFLSLALHFDSNQGAPIGTHVAKRAGDYDVIVLYQ